MLPVSKCVYQLQKNISIAHQKLQDLENNKNTKSDSNISDTKVLEKNVFIDEEKAKTISNRKKAKSRQAITKMINITTFFSKDEKFNLESSNEESQNLDCVNTENNQQQSFKNNQQQSIENNQQQSIDNTIKKIEIIIKNKKLRKVELVHYQLVIWYLHLPQSEKNKKDSSETVATYFEEKVVPDLGFTTPQIISVRMLYTFWRPDNKQPLRKKDLDAASGANCDGYWNRVNSMTLNILNTNQINLYSEDNQPLLHSAMWNSDIQEIVFPSDYEIKEL
ncbi:7383_t:CDS:2 [Dentiscutata heterogama]|uniref:7383_t:CDS:1 n=1 Tax=Dentiscutata heterogama TaxID=1316150 RepID=A0ACA9M2J3_9GLOM|nr:7383_t:CDS:2 [Dentiscutata heterogama]